MERYFLVKILYHLPFRLVFGWGEEGGQEWDVNFLLGRYMGQSGPFTCAFHYALLGFKEEGRVCRYDRKLGRSWLGLGSPLEAELFCVSGGSVWGASVCYG